MPAEAEYEFIRKAAAFDTYGFDPYSVKVFPHVTKLLNLANFADMHKEPNLKFVFVCIF